MVAARLLLGSTLAFGLYASRPLFAQAQQQFAPMVDVRNTFLTEALQRLGTLGFHNVRVAQQSMPDMPEGVVLWQYPVPSPMQFQAAVPRWPTTGEIVLIVAHAYPVLPNLSEWRADHALTLLGLIGLTGTIDPAADAAHSQVIGQSIAPGPVRPGETLSLNLAPLRVDTTIVRDTVFQTVTGPANERAGVPPMVVVLISLAALGAGALGTTAAIRLRRPPHLPGPPDGSGSPPRPDETQPGPRKLGVAAFEPVIIDEVVWVIRGSAHSEGGAR